MSRIFWSASLGALVAIIATSACGPTRTEPAATEATSTVRVALQVDGMT